MSAAGDAFLSQQMAAAGTLRGPFPTPFWAPAIPEVYAHRWVIASASTLRPWLDTNDPEGFAQAVFLFALDADGARLFRGAPQRAALGKLTAAREINQVANFVMGNILVDGESPAPATLDGVEADLD